VQKNEFAILVAEDDEMVRDVIVRFLSDEGYSVNVAEDGLEAIRALRRQDIKLVITDLRMPGADGMEVLRTALQINPQMAVVLVTAYGTLDLALEAMREGAYDYIVKPFVMQQMLLVVRNAFRLVNLMEENRKLSEQLKEEYRSRETSNILNNATDENIKGDPDRRIERLRELDLIDDEEARILKQRLVADDSKESIRKFSTLVDNLKSRD
jgi:DNA-binding NtrC family response regulator